jgi:hypothetical protein
MNSDSWWYILGIIMMITSITAIILGAIIIEKIFEDDETQEPKPE